MSRKFSAAIVLSVLAAAQNKHEPVVIPAEIAADSYAIYSAALNPPKLSHRDENQKYLVVDVTTSKPFRDPQSCVQPPPSYREGFSEIAADYLKHENDSFRLEPKFSMSKPYEFLTEAEANQFQKGRIVLQTGPTNDVPKFLGAIDLIRLGNVYFNRSRTLAAVSTEAWCGGLCALDVWRIFEKKDSRWRELNWNSCVRVSRRGAANLAEVSFEKFP